MHQRDLEYNPRLKTKAKLIEGERDELGRRKWEIEYKEANQQQSPELDPKNPLRKDPREQNFLVGRTEKIDIKSKLGRQEQLKKGKRDNGFMCDLCQQLFTCDIAFITHLNSASHNAKLGMSLKVQNVTIDSIKNKLANLSKNAPKPKAVLKQQKTITKTKERVQMLNRSIQQPSNIVNKEKGSL